jgi:hypothetical protein
MKACRECGEEFTDKTRDGHQEFCREQHRQSWHYRQRKRATVRMGEMGIARMSGHAPPALEIELNALFPRKAEEPIRRRRIA